MLKLPGLIDPHVHPRGLPTDSYKEDFLSCTAAALAGGFTTIMDMPNNPKTPTITHERLIEKEAFAKNQALCDIGFYFGSDGENLDEFLQVEKMGAFGLKVFLSFSTANLKVTPETFEKICNKWPTHLPILLHAETDTIQKALTIAQKTGHRIHICHVSSAFELQQIIDAKNKNFQVTCGATPHHLFLNQEDEKRLGSFGLMKPSLKPQSDVDFLWKHIDQIDVVESDHAPHSREEKNSDNPPYGVTGLETTLSLLLTAVKEQKLTINDIIRLCHTGPAKIFNIQQDEQTYIEVNEQEAWVVDDQKLFTKAKSSPWNGITLRGKVKKVYIRGINVFDNGQIMVKPGFGKIIKSNNT